MTARQSLTEAVQRAASRAVAQEAPGWLIATVTATYADGTVDIATSRGPVEKVRRLKSYSTPAVGDMVKVDYNSDGNWIVAGSLATS
ncbi:hypothetical protein CP967_31150 [Streptomyces nitrosporeus]|uniref:DUF5666 domain-containing protein n=1 Tax=Streptomyces nitrosporeus TaxID=28894 RepID=A0A5J6FGY6_9ACTN|nr:hypothetical protein [Streptomyces nitrosporeus]QEU75829.1 hypothetical protein CP967_31150 [Streptomyces nitrosporeus]GGY88612.1 hypothetical protein GCM10010327_19160 [Streptomyces nitrosporeus]